MAIPRCVLNALNSKQIAHKIVEADVQTKMAALRTPNNDEQLAIMVLLEANGEKLQAIVSSNSLLNVDALNELTGQHVEAVCDEGLNQLLANKGLETLPALAEVTGYPTFLDQQLLKAETIHIESGSCTLIEESEALQCQAAEVTFQQLAEQLPDLNIGLIHGRLKAAEKARIMAQFKAGEINLLVATTVVEVGVDVPNASLMIIENPERLGLSQLHQLRGRVGRGAEQSFCVLMYSNPLSRQGRERLNIMRESSDGFVIAEKDLELRGPGEVLGTRQTGIMDFKIANFELSNMLIPQTQACAQQILQYYPERVKPLIQRWLGSSQRYGKV